MGRHLHIGEITKDKEHRKKITDEQLQNWMEDLYHTSKELIRGFKFINKS